MSTKTSNLIAQITYKDGNTRNYSLPIADTEIILPSYIKGRIQAFNTAAQDTTSSVYKTFVSDQGANIASVTEAKIVTKEETVIYNG